jgi:hypothetical protein
MGTELFHADGLTDIKKLIVPFRNFANAPKTFQCVLYRAKSTFVLKYAYST